MQTHKLPLSDTGIYGKLMMDYIEGNPALRPFYKYTPSITSIPEIIEDRKQFAFHRELLAGELEDQHRTYFHRFPLLASQIERIRDENTFTVTTGHQPCLAGGPMFFIYKLVTTINLSRTLCEKYPDYHFVPVFWLGAEDHDLDEVNHVVIHGKTIRWQSNQKGATGRMSTAGLDVFIEEIREIIGNDALADQAVSLLKEAYLSHVNLADATRAFALALFGEHGLLVLDADRPALKKVMQGVFHQELALQVSRQFVDTTSEELGRTYKIQVTPREINLFYLDDQLRERIVLDEKGHFEVVNTDLEFTKDFIVDLVDRQPERFSPNVILRPLYQEMILPNLAYIGGPGELAYWLQLKEMFAQLQVSYPMLVPRNNALIVPARALSKFRQLGFELKDMFRPYETLAKEWLSSQEDLSDSVEGVKSEVHKMFEQLSMVFTAVDPTLSPAVMAEAQKTMNSLDNLMKKGNAALKRKHEVALNQIKLLVDKVNPNDQPQERLVNLFQFYPRHGNALLDQIITEMTPLSGDMMIIEE